MKIDTQHHILPDCYKKTLANAGITTHTAVGGLLPQWSPELMIELMDRCEISTVITSIVDPGINFIDEKFTANIARVCNIYSADLIQKYPQKIGAFGLLPMPYVGASLLEIEHSLDTLKLDGIVLLSNYSEKYLGDETFRPVFEELNRRNAVVFIHPTTPVVYNPKAILPPGTLDFVFDTTRTIVSLLLSGYISKFNKIRFLVAHAGGTIPFVSTRLSYLESLVKQRPDRMPGEFNNVPEGVINALKTLYYDTTLSSKSPTLKSLLDFVDSKKITIGTDFPFLPEAIVKEELNDLEHFLLDKDLRDQLYFKTALELFPRFNQ